MPLSPEENLALCTANNKRQSIYFKGGLAESEIERFRALGYFISIIEKPAFVFVSNYQTLYDSKGSKVELGMKI